jgi:membrane protein DedA with SNARE-associated domain
MFDSELGWKCFFVFTFLFFLLWVTFYTYQPWFLKSTDFISPESTRREDTNKNSADKYLSDPGRNTIYLASLIPAVVASILLYFILYFMNREKFLIRKKGAKNERSV